MSISALSGHAHHYYTPISGNSTGQGNPLSKLEDSNGKISRDSFVKNRPPGVSESDAGSLFDKIDSGKTGSLSESQLQDGLQKYGPQASKNSDNASSSDNGDLASLFQSLSSGTFASLLQSQQTSDSGSSNSDPFKSLEDSNGKISRDSFVKHRPPGISEKDAGALFDKIDSSKSGSLTSSELQDGLKANAPQQANSSSNSQSLADLLFGDNSSSSTSSSKSQSLVDYLFNNDNSSSSNNSSTSASNSSTSLETLLKAINSYSSKHNASNTYDLTSSLLQIA